MFGEMAPSVFAQIGCRFYIVFAVCSFTNAITIWLFFPETKGRTLEEMDRYFREVPIIVGFAKVESVDRNRREREFREGESSPPLLDHYHAHVRSKVISRIRPFLRSLRYRKRISPSMMLRRVDSSTIQKYDSLDLLDWHLKPCNVDDNLSINATLHIVMHD